MASKRDPQKQAELDAAKERIVAAREANARAAERELYAAKERILQERAERDAASATPRGISESLERLDRVSDVVPVAHDAPSYDIFDAAPTRREIGKPEADWRMSFIDRTAIGLYVAGYPQTKIYDHAARLWELRAQWRKGRGL